ncbi:hypothetical protein ABUJ25_23270, partial [Salmonella enterica subsp. enterica serovar Orion]|uniref:hypothetical protein n=1 Tax=Salmonella enterica TaxID=28901 RepID=UPI003315EE29
FKYVESGNDANLVIVIDCQIPANVLIVPCIFSDFEILVLKRMPMRQGIKSDMKKITDAGDNLCQKNFSI